MGLYLLYKEAESGGWIYPSKYIDEIALFWGFTSKSYRGRDWLG